MKRESDPLSKPSKRVKIVEPLKSMESDDSNVDSDIDLEVKAKKGRVKTDGYSDDDEDDDDEEGEQDMFAEPKNVKKFLSPDQIEGQEFDSTSDEKVEPFHMKTEMEEGDFDETGHYVRKTDEFAMHDTWLQGLSKNEMEQARKAHDLQVARTKAQDAQDALAVDSNSLWYTVLSYLLPRETILQAIARLAPKKVPKWKLKKTTPVPQDPQKIRDLEALTDISNKLFDVDANTFDKTYESISRSLLEAGLLSDEWMPGNPLPDRESVKPKDSRMFEYKWNSDASELHGPFTLAEIVAWRDQGFFDQKVLFRRVDANTPLDTKSNFVLIDDLTL